MQYGNNLIIKTSEIELDSLNSTMQYGNSLAKSTTLKKGWGLNSTMQYGNLKNILFATTKAVV